MVLVACVTAHAVGSRKSHLGPSMAPSDRIQRSGLTMARAVPPVAAVSACGAAPAARAAVGLAAVAASA